MIRRTANEQIRLVLCVDLVDLDLECAQPAGLAISGFHKRHPQARQRPPHMPRVYRAEEAARLVDEWTAGATIVGVMPQFDTECLAPMFERHNRTPRWRAEVVDVVPLGIAAVRARGRKPALDTDALSRQCRVRPPRGGQRHTALGDARWAMRWYDALSP